MSFRQLADAPRHLLASLARDLSVNGLFLTLGSGTAGVTAFSGDANYSFTRTGVGTYQLRVPRGIAGANWGIGLDDLGASYIFDWSAVTTGVVTITRTGTPADPTAEAQVELLFAQRMNKEL